MRPPRNYGVDVTWTEGKQPVREVLENADAMVSCSAHEGLSLAHLEGISSGLPVIACDTGGTRELAWRNPAVTLLAGGRVSGRFRKSHRRRLARSAAVRPSAGLAGFHHRPDDPPRRDARPAGRLPQLRRNDLVRLQQSIHRRRAILVAPPRQILPPTRPAGARRPAPGIPGTSHAGPPRSDRHPASTSSSRRPPA